MINIAICDDDLHFADYIEKILIGRVDADPDAFKFYKFGSGEELVKSFEKRIPFHLLILDMQMKKMDGDETAREFRKKYPHAVLVFCSGVCHPTVKSFEANAFRYLMKEYDSDRMEKELKVIVEELRKRESTRSVAISYRNETILAAPEDVLYVSIRKHGCNIVLYDRANKKVSEHICNQSISDLFDELGTFRFAYAHNSYFVNLGYVVGIASNEVKLADGTVLAISKSREKMFKEALAIYLADRY